MARSMIEAPWEVTFPQVCARCMAPAEKSVRLQRQKPSAQMWTFWFGVIGSAIAGARKGNTLTFEIPYCGPCRRRERIFPWAIAGALLLGLASLCSFPALASQLQEPYDPLLLIGTLVTLLGTLVLLGGALALGVVAGAHKAIHVKRIDERSGSVQLAFRNPAYFAQFCQDNLERITSFALRHGKPLPIPADQAIAAVGQHIDDQDPRSPASLKGYFERGQLYLQAGMHNLALADLNRVIQVTGFENPHFLEAQFFRGQVYMQMGNHLQAQTDLENYVQASSDRARVRQAKQWLKQLARA